MKDRERTIAALSFAKPDRIPFEPGSGRQSTLRAWRQQGLPPDEQDYQAYIRRVLDIPPASPRSSDLFNADIRMIPQFEEKVIEHRPAPPGADAPGVLVVQDWKGNICEISDEYDVTYLRSAKDFVTRTWIRCPVESRNDWPDMARRYDANDVARFPADWEQHAARLRNRAVVHRITVTGPFWQMREWCGFEGLCVLMADDPTFVDEMAAFWSNFVAGLLQRLLTRHVPDVILVNEDMAYKEKAMISPAMTRRFLMPAWRRWAALCRDAGVPIYAVDSDGYVGDLIPLWIEAGFRMNYPCEVAAGNDLPAYRGRFGIRMAYTGGVDKRAMAAGGNAIRAELERLRPAVEAGGFIPSCDHAVPADVTWPKFLDYCRCLAQMTGWLP